MLLTLRVQCGQVRGAVGAPEPQPPVPDVSVTSNAVGSPVIVGVAHEVVVVAQCDSKAAVFVSQPVLAGRVMDEDQSDRSRAEGWDCQLKCVREALAG